MIAALPALLAYGRAFVRRACAQAWRHWLNRDCWHPELGYHPGRRWIFRCLQCGRPLNTRPMGAIVHD